MKNLRLKEVKILLYRIMLCYVFYQIARILFSWHNKDLIPVENIYEYLCLAYHGLAFDTTAILYVNALFIILSLIPFFNNTSPRYQRILFYLYFITNAITFAMNFGDIVYFQFSKVRLNSSVLDVVKNEHNLIKVFYYGIIQNISLLFWYIILMISWIILYKRVKIKAEPPKHKTSYIASSIALLIIAGMLTIGGIRGSFHYFGPRTGRPINIVDANEHIHNPEQANLVLNSVFSFFRTLKKKGFKEVHFYDDKFIATKISSYKKYENKSTAEATKPNIVIFIVESLSREYIGAFNNNTSIPDFESYTPFLDSLSQKNLIFPNAFANGRISIHGMSSILSGIPALKEAFTSSPYTNQKIESLVSICNDLGYQTSFFHGAPNGSMDFLGFSNILGFNDYYGKNEYNNDNDFDGVWAIWDEPFLQYFANNIGKNEPFLATVFTATSHHPFQIPQNYEGKFKEGKYPMHKPMQYTDYSIRQFFNTAQKKAWFSNTIFVITGDHTNIPYYAEYKKTMNRFAVPILFYSPNPKYNLKGVSTKYAQQIDIYPTLLDIIGYDKTFRSWGRSLITEKEEHFIVNSNGIQEQFIIGEYVYCFDGSKVTGVYDIKDLALEKNLINSLNKESLQKKEQICKSWYQDYMNRIIQKRLN